MTGLHVTLAGPLAVETIIEVEEVVLASPPVNEPVVMRPARDNTPFEYTIPGPPWAGE